MDQRPHSAPPSCYALDVAGRLPDIAGQWSWVRACDRGDHQIPVPPLHAAVCSRNLLAVRRTLLHASSTTRLNETDIKGQTALNVAAAAGFHAAVEALLAAGADGEVATRGKGITPLFSASLFGHAPCARLLLHSGVDVHALTTDEYRATALWAAARGGHAAVVEALVDYGADPDMGSETELGDGSSKNPELGTTPLWVAVAGGHINAIDTLLTAGADPNRAGLNNGTTPLFLAAKRGDAETCRKLLAAGADPNWGNHEGVSPLRVAEGKGWSDTLRLLRHAHSITGGGDDDGGSATERIGRGSRSCCGPGCPVREARLKCSQCRFARYCSVGCQREHWPEHSVRCVALASRFEGRLLQDAGL